MKQHLLTWPVPVIMPVAAPVPSPGQLLLHLGPKYIRFARDKDVREVAFGRPVPPRLVAEAFVLPTTHDNVGKQGYKLLT